MPLPSKLRSNLTSVPILDDSFAPPKLKASSDSGVTELSYSQFQFDKQADKIGQGGNAVVYRARIPSQDVTVALKQPFPNKTVREKTVQRILNEAETWAKVDDHPYIASILDWGYDAIPWVAIEYVDGGAITDHIEEFSILQRLWTAYAIVDAVAYANGQRGIVHHDLKPDNILLQTTSEGLYDVPKVVDWGLSRELIQHTGSVSQATPEYAAPEQFDALLPDMPVGVHTDVYQLGIVCYEILTGEHPDHLRGEVPLPTEMNPGIPEALDPIIMKSIAHQRDQRYDHPIQLRDRLENVIKDNTLGSRSVDGNCGISDSSPWLIHRGNSTRTGYHPTAIGPKSGVTVEWQFETEKSNLGEPIVVDSSLYFGNSNRFYSINAQQGIEEWFATMDEFMYGTPLFVNGTVFTGGDKLYALNAKDGTELWSYQFASSGAPWASPLIRNGTLYFNSKSSIQAVDAEKGTEEWYELTGGDMKSAPAMAGNTIFTAAEGIDGSIIYALDAEQGQVRWKTEIGSWVNSALAVANGTIYFGCWDDHIYALDSSNGTERWRFNTDDRIVSAPAVADRTVYVGSRDASIYALNARNGALLWQFETGDGVSSSPSVADDIVYIGSNDQKVYALDGADGTERWRYDTGAPVNTTPVITDKMLYVGNENGICALTAR
jgi:outer membrane protein assembly factor BamB/tRNA A-37 threonylcarbamoyl transferase component Bud32